MLKFCGDRIPMAPRSKMTSTKEARESIQTSIVIEKETAGLGVEIVGGSDTYLGGVVVNVIEPGGAVAMDGRIAVGDQIVMVNGESLRGMNHKNAISALRLASSPVKITILREDPEVIFTSAEDPSTVFEVKLVKSITDYMGLSILARKDRKGVFVTYVSEDSIAFKEGSIHQGDRILEVNGVSLKNSIQEEACKALRRTFGTVNLKVGRISSLYSSLCLTKASKTYVNHALEDDGDTKENFRRWNSFGFEHRKKRKIPHEDNNLTPSRRRSLSCRDYSEASSYDLELERASSGHDIRGGSPSRNNKGRAAESRGRFRYVYPEKIELSFGRDRQKLGSYQKEDYV